MAHQTRSEETLVNVVCKYFAALVDVPLWDDGVKGGRLVAKFYDQQSAEQSVRNASLTQAFDGRAIWLFSESFKELGGPSQAVARPPVKRACEARAKVVSSVAANVEVFHMTPTMRMSPG